MIIVKIIGGIGNQLFQYAVGRAVANYHQVPLKLDITGYETYNLHNGFRLDQFNIEANLATPAEVTILKGGSNILYRLLRAAGLVKFKTYYAEKQRSIYDPAVFEESSRYLDGYWQNEKYFLQIRQVLLEEFSSKTPLSTLAQGYLSRIQNTNAVSLHVRRGDYLRHPEIGVLDLSYYQQAHSYLISKVENPVFYIFSNDQAWCKQNLKFIENALYIEDTATEIDDLILMSQCRHNIVANSSFSWWGAWLNKNVNYKIIIAPKKWRRDDLQNFKYLPDSWVKIDSI
jgi:hypothetical protein